MPRMSEQRRRYIKDSIKAGYTSEKIKDMFGTSVGTIVNLKREMGIPVRQQSKETKFTVPEVATAGIVEVAQAMEATVMHHRDIPRSLGMATAPTTVAHPYSPQEYFVAIAEGLRSRDAETAALRDEVTGLRSMAARLEGDNLRLMSDLNQCKLQMANWSGPVSLPSMSLGNGG